MNGDKASIDGIVGFMNEADFPFDSVGERFLVHFFTRVSIFKMSSECRILSKVCFKMD